MINNSAWVMDLTKRGEKIFGMDYALPRDGSVTDDGTGRREGNVVLQQDPQVPQSSYQRALDEGVSDPHILTTETVRYWSDFNRVFYHPRSIVQINDYELGSSLMPFENFDNGQELFADVDRDEDLLDRDLRPWAEECDQMQGIQVWTSGDDAWGGFASRYAERLRDEFGKIGLWTWSAEEEKGRGIRAKQLLKLTNAAKTLAEMSTHASMFVPMSLPARLPQYIHLDHESVWHTTAMLSTALETATLPSRLKGTEFNRGFLSAMEAALNINGNQRIAQMQCSVLEPKTITTPHTQTRGVGDPRAPSSIQRSMVEDDGDDPTIKLDVDLSGGDLVSSRTEGAHPSDRAFGALDCLRGRPAAEPGMDEGAMSEEDDLGDARKKARFDGRPIIERYRTPLPYPRMSSFPAIFPTPSYHDSIAVHTSLATSSRMLAHVQAMQTIVNKTVASDEREALSNNLGTIAEAYEEGWADHGEDSEDD